MRRRTVRIGHPVDGQSADYGKPWAQTKCFLCERPFKSARKLPFPGVHVGQLALPARGSRRSSGGPLRRSDVARSSGRLPADRRGIAGTNPSPVSLPRLGRRSCGGRSSTRSPRCATIPSPWPPVPCCFRPLRRSLRADPSPPWQTARDGQRPSPAPPAAAGARCSRGGCRRRRARVATDSRALRRRHARSLGGVVALRPGHPCRHRQPPHVSADAGRRQSSATWCRHGGRWCRDVAQDGLRSAAGSRTTRSSRSTHRGRDAGGAPWRRASRWGRPRSTRVSWLRGSGAVADVWCQPAPDETPGARPGLPRSGRPVSDTTLRRVPCRSVCGRAPSRAIPRGAWGRGGYSRAASALVPAPRVGQGAVSVERALPRRVVRRLVDVDDDPRPAPPVRPTRLAYWCGVAAGAAPWRPLPPRARPLLAARAADVRCRPPPAAPALYC